jgi:hypothetical protein
MIVLVAGALLCALAADPASSSTPGEASRAADDSQRGSRDPAAGRDERTGPPGAGVTSGEANSMAGGRTDEGPRGGTGIREGGDRIRKDHQRARANAQARGRNKKGSFERPADTPAQMNRNPKPLSSSGPQEDPGGSSTRGVSGKGAEKQPDKKETGAEPPHPK